MSVQNDVENGGYQASENTKIVKCANCGGNMVFDPVSQQLKCPHCGTYVNFYKDGNVEEKDIEAAFKEAKTWKEQTTVYRCTNCGAEFVVKSDEVAVICPYCSTSHVMRSEAISGVAPNAVYPFLLTKTQGAESAKKWAKKRIFAPSKFKKNLQEHNVRGMYLPCFTFDSETLSEYQGRIGQYRTRTVRDSKGNSHTETYTEWYYVSGQYEQFFDDLTISCGKMTQSEMQKIMPFKSESLCVYEEKFLTGYIADHYTRDIKDCWNDAKEDMDQRIRQGILTSHGGDVVDYLNVSTTHSNVKYKYVLLPVYRLNFRFKSKDYPLLVNGSTGRVTGKSPVSPWRVTIAVLLGLAVVAGVGAIIYYSGFFEDTEKVSPDYVYELSAEENTNNLSLSDYFAENGYKLSI